MGSIKIIILSERKSDEILNPELKGKKICYVSTESTYKEVKTRWRPHIKDMIIIDALSGYYKQRINDENIILTTPEVENLKEKIHQGLKRGYGTIIIDTISALLNYNPHFKIIHFVNDLTSLQAQSILLASQESYAPEETKRLIEDAALFSSEVIKA